MTHRILQNLTKIINYIDEQIQNELTVNEIAKHTGYSPFHFSRIFKEVVGEMPMEYVTKRKLQFALRDMSQQAIMGCYFEVSALLNCLKRECLKKFSR